MTIDRLQGVRLVIFDADDTLRQTIIEGQPCPRAADEWTLMPGVLEAMSRIDWTSGPRVAIASNQDQVGYGLIPRDLAERMLFDLIGAATKGRARDPLVRLCPHTLEESCACRKPAPGMLLDLLNAANVDRGQALFVGNADCDREAARRAGVPFSWSQDFFRP